MPYYYPHRPYNQRKKVANFSITFWLIAINFLIFIVMLPLVYSNPGIISYIALVPAKILLGKQLWTLATHMFTHILPWHLFANMVSLLFLGSFLEKLIGPKRFIKTYLISGLAGAALFILLYTLSDDLRVIALSFFIKNIPKEQITALGASAAIFGIAGMLTLLTPRLPVLVFFIIPMQLWQAILFLMIALSFIPQTANSAHLGGLLVGLIYGFYLRKKYPRKIYLLNRFLARA